MSGAVQYVGIPHQANEWLNVHCDLCDTESQHTEATTRKRFNRQAWPHMKRSKGHRFSEAVIQSDRELLFAGHYALF